MGDNSMGIMDSGSRVMTIVMIAHNSRTIIVVVMHGGI